MSVPAGRRFVGLLALACLLLAARPYAAAAQAGAAVLGRVYDAETDAAVQNAIVTLEGFGSTLTDPEGRFRFRGVGAGTYTLRVEGFSYAPYSERVDVDGDVSLEVALGSSPLPLDSLIVEAGTVDYHGRVRDPVRDFNLLDAQVIVRGRDPVWTDSHGRFDVRDLPEGLPVSITVRAVGYVSVDTTLVPDDEERHDFELERDPFAEALLAIQAKRLEERADGRAAVGRWAEMDREEVLRYATGSHSLSTMLEFEYPEHIRGRIVCTYIDEREANLTTYAPYPEEIERIELLQFDALPDRPLMLQIFTRSFVMAMATQDVKLRTPTMIPGACF